MNGDDLLFVCFRYRRETAVFARTPSHRCLGHDFETHGMMPSTCSRTRKGTQGCPQLCALNFAKATSFSLFSRQAVPCTICFRECAKAHAEGWPEMLVGRETLTRTTVRSKVHIVTETGHSFGIRPQLMMFCLPPSASIRPQRSTSGACWVRGCARQHREEEKRMCGSPLVRIRHGSKLWNVRVIETS